MGRGGEQGGAHRHVHLQAEFCEMFVSSHSDGSRHAFSILHSLKIASRTWKLHIYWKLMLSWVVHVQVFWWHLWNSLWPFFKVLMQLASAMSSPRVNFLLHSCLIHSISTVFANRRHKFCCLQAANRDPLSSLSQSPITYHTEKLSVLMRKGNLYLLTLA